MKKWIMVALVALSGCEATALDPEPNPLPTAWAGHLVYTSTAKPSGAAVAAAVSDTVLVEGLFEHWDGREHQSGGKTTAIVKFSEVGPDKDTCHIWFLSSDDQFCQALLDGEGSHFRSHGREALVVAFDVPVQPSSSASSASAARAGWPEHCKFGGEVRDGVWYGHLRCGDAGEIKAEVFFTPIEG